MAWLVKNSPAMWEAWVQYLGWEGPLKKKTATHSSIPAWRIPWTIQSMGSQRVIVVHICFWNRIFNFLDTHPGVGFLDHMVTLFFFLRNLHTVYHSGCTNLYYFKQCRNILFSPLILQNLIIVLFYYSHFEQCEVLPHSLQFWYVFFS